MQYNFVPPFNANRVRAHTAFEKTTDDCYIHICKISKVDSDYMSDSLLECLGQSVHVIVIGDIETIRQRNPQLRNCGFLHLNWDVKRTVDDSN